MPDSLTTRCCICFEHFDTDTRLPRVLHKPVNGIPHIFCTTCLSSHLKAGKIECSLCREVVDVAEGVVTLRVDKNVIHVDVRPDTVKTEQTGRKCTMCDGPANTACHTCGWYVCKDCRTIHTMSWKKEDHKFIEIDEMTEEDRETFKEIELCKKQNHKKYDVDRYCGSCRVVGCYICMDRDHSGHETSSIDVIFEAKIKEANRLLESRDTIKTVSAQVERRRRVVSGRQHASSQKITQLFTQLRDVINAAEEDCRLNLKENNTPVLNDLPGVIPLEVFENTNRLMDSLEPCLVRNAKISVVNRIKRIDEIGNAFEIFNPMAFVPFSEQQITSECYEFVPTESVLPKFKSMLDDIIGSSWSVKNKTRRGSEIEGGIGRRQNKEIRMLVLGKPKSGRGKMCYYFLKKEWMSETDTRKRPGCKVWNHEHHNVLYKLVYTPGLSNIQFKGGSKRESVDIFRLTTPGAHVILLVVNIADDDVSFFHEYRALFNTDITRHVIIVFVGKHTLDARGVGVEEYILARRGDLKKLLAAVGHRYIVCNLRDKEDEGRFRNELVDMVNKVDLANGNTFLTLKDVSKT